MYRNRLVRVTCIFVILTGVVCWFIYLFTLSTSRMSHIKFQISCQLDSCVQCLQCNSANPAHLSLRGSSVVHTKSTGAKQFSVDRFLLGGPQ